jgi:hypothetical protein
LSARAARGLPVSAAVGLRAPRQDGAVLADPPLERVGGLLEENRRRLAHGPPLLGRAWAELRHEARQAAVRAARDYLRQAGEPLPSTATDSLLLAGHQPELFHPGVWVKNFALHGVGRQHGVTPVNLVVDNDTVKATALHVPAMTVPPPPIDQSHPTLLSVPFDRWTSEAPYEERAVEDEALFASLPERARQPWGFTPLLPEFWEEALRQAQRTPLLGERFAAARRSLERRWGCHNLELPLSALCRTEPFAWFACHLLTHLPAFHELYNRTVHDYRRRQGIRSRNHPVPDLGATGDWLEAPFWAWRAGQARRARLFVRRTPSALELRAGEEAWPALPLPGEDNGQAAVRVWLALERRGLKVRSRALTTTLYSRLFLGDLFIHGIGGGKYDELTDGLIHGFYGLQPPAFLVLSATLLLPLPPYPGSPEACGRLAREARDVHYNPQRHLPEAGGADEEARRLVREKQAWIDRPCPTRRQRRERFRVLRRLTEELRARLAKRERELRDEWRRCEKEAAGNAVLRRRDYPFCLYPEAQLRPFCTQFLHRGGPAHAGDGAAGHPTFGR